MLNYDYTGKILGLEDAIVQELTETEREIHVKLEMPRREHCCPRCRRNTDRIHDYIMQMKRSSPIREKKVFLHIRKRRYVCPDCGKRFYEEVSFVPKYYQVTRSLIYGVLNSLREMRTMNSIGKAYNVSGSTVARYLDVLSFDKPNLTQCISIDEYRGNSGGEKFQCILTNPKKHKILDLLPNRKSNDLCTYFSKFKDRNNVKYIIMDMSNLFRSVANTCFPNAEIIADKYHVIRLVGFAFENVRKNEQNKFSKQYRKVFKRSKSLLRKPWNKLKDDEKEQVALMLETSPRIAKAYYLKEEFTKIFKLELRSEASKALGDWILKMQIEALPEFQNLGTTFRIWQNEILNIFEYKLTNAYTEGSNNKSKVLKRISYGMPNFERFLKRRLYLEVPG